KGDIDGAGGLVGDDGEAGGAVAGGGGREAHGHGGGGGGRQGERQGGSREREFGGVGARKIEGGDGERTAAGIGKRQIGRGGDAAEGDASEVQGGRGHGQGRRIGRESGSGQCDAQRRRGRIIGSQGKGRGGGAGSRGRKADRNRRGSRGSQGDGKRSRESELGGLGSRKGEGRNRQVGGSGIGHGEVQGRSLRQRNVAEGEGSGRGRYLGGGDGRRPVGRPDDESNASVHGYGWDGQGAARIGRNGGPGAGHGGPPVAELPPGLLGEGLQAAGSNVHGAVPGERHLVGLGLVLDGRRDPADLVQEIVLLGARDDVGRVVGEGEKALILAERKQPVQV